MMILSQTPMTVVNSSVDDSFYETWVEETSYTVSQKVYLPENFGEYEAKTDNSGKKPNENPLDWKFLGTTNKFKMFDQFLNTQTKGVDLQTEVLCYGATFLFLGNITAKSVTIEVFNNSTLEVIESETFKLSRKPTGWIDFFYGGWFEDCKTSIVYRRKTLTRNISFIVKFDNGINEAGCGIFFPAKEKKTGITQSQLKISGIDYSTINKDPDSGATYLKQGNFANTIDLKVYVPYDQTDTANKFIIDSRGKPIVVVNSKSIESVNLFCYMQTYEIDLEGSKGSWIPIKVVGLI